MKLNKSAARTVDVLELIAKSEAPMTLLEIEKALQIPKSSTFELVYTLVQKGFIEKVDNKFTLGVHAFQISVLYAQKLDIIQMSKEVLEELSKKTKETVFLAKYINDKMVYIDKHSKYTDISTTCSIGESKDLYCTALGKAILSKQSDSEIEEYFSRVKAVKRTEYTIDNAQAMKEDVLNIRARGYAIENREGSYNTFCIACPILNYQNYAIAAASIAIPFYRVEADKIDRFGALVNKAALTISNRLGFTGHSLY